MSRVKKEERSERSAHWSQVDQKSYFPRIPQISFNLPKSASVSGEVVHRRHALSQAESRAHGDGFLFAVAAESTLIPPAGE